MLNYIWTQSTANIFVEQTTRLCHTSVETSANICGRMCGEVFDFISILHGGASQRMRHGLGYAIMFVLRNRFLATTLRNESATKKVDSTDV